MSNNLVAYYRLGDPVGSYSVQDSSGNGNTGSLINGVNGEPSYGATGVFLYDTDGALDLTSGTNTSGGGFDTNDQTAESPVINDPLADADDWTVELWFQWLGGTAVPAAAIIPPGLTTDITHPPGFPAGSLSIPAAASVVSDATYAMIGDLAILGVVVGSPTVTVTEVDGEVSDSWTLQVRNQDAINNQCVDIWTATVTSTAAPDVLTLTYSVDDVSEIGGYYWIDSLTVGQGANTIWGIPDIGVNQDASDTTTVVFPSLNANNDTNPQAYWGLGSSNGTMSAGGTPSFTYEQVGGSGLALNLDIYPGGNPWQPTSGTTSSTFVTAGMVVEASIQTSASTPAVPNATLLRVNGPNEFEPFSSYELQLGFAEVPGNSPGQISTLANAVVESFGSFDGYNVWQFPSVNPFDGHWHHLVKSNALPYPYLDNNAPSSQNFFFSTSIGANIAGLVFGTAPGGVGLDPNGGTLFAQPFAGLLDEVALYNAALTTEQISNHYNTALWFQQPEFGAANGPASVGRTNKVLSVCGLDPSIVLEVPYDFMTELYAETDTLVSTSGLNYLQTTTQTESGLIFQGTNGKIYCFNREYQYLNESSITSQATFSDSEDSPYFYDGPSLQIAGDDIDLWSDVQVQSGIPATATTEQIEVGVLQEWGPAQSSLAAYSASVWGNRTLQGLTALQFAYDADALYTAQFLLSIYALPLLRVTQMTINAQGNMGANIPQMLQRTLWDRLTIEYTGQTPGPTFSQESIVEQVTHNADMSIPSWSTTYAMSPYEILLNAFYLDTSMTNGPDVLVL